MSAVPDLALTSISVPPLKSMPKFSPWVKNSVIAKIDSSAEIGKLMRRKRVKSKCVLSGTIRSDGNQTERADHGQHGNQNAKPDENEMCHSRLRIVSANMIQPCRIMFVTLFSRWGMICSENRCPLFGII